MFSVDSPRVGAVKQHHKKKTQPKRSLNQMLQRTLRGVIDENVFLSWKETVMTAMKAGRTTAIVAFLQKRIHYKLEDDSNSEVITWKFKENMKDALKWISNEGLSYDLIFDRERGRETLLPALGALSLQWFPSRCIESAEGTLMYFWRNRMNVDIVVNHQSKQDWFRHLKRGLITTGQQCVTLMLLEKNQDFYIKTPDDVRKTDAKLCCENKCRDFLTKEVLLLDIFKCKSCYLDPSLGKILRYLKNEDLDWFIGFDVIHERAYIPGETSIQKTIELYQNNADTDKDMDLDELGRFEENQKAKVESKSVWKKKLSSWAYFMVTKRGW